MHKNEFYVRMPSQQHFPQHKIRGTGKAKVTLKLEHNAKNIGKEIKIFVPQMKLESREIKVKQAPSFFSSSTSLSFLLAFFFVFFISTILSLSPLFLSLPLPFLLSRFFSLPFSFLSLSPSPSVPTSSSLSSFTSYSLSSSVSSTTLHSLPLSLPYSSPLHPPPSRLQILMSIT